MLSWLATSAWCPRVLVSPARASPSSPLSRRSWSSAPSSSLASFAISATELNITLSGSSARTSHARLQSVTSNMATTLHYTLMLTRVRCDGVM